MSTNPFTLIGVEQAEQHFIATEPSWHPPVYDPMQYSRGTLVLMAMQLPEMSDMGPDQVVAALELENLPQLIVSTFERHKRERHTHELFQAVITRTESEVTGSSKS